MRAALLALVSAAALSGCAASRFDRLFEAGEYDAAVGAFAADSSLRDNERALFRAAVAYALPGQPSYNPQQARALLERLLRTFPESAYEEPARALAGSLTDVERLTTDVRRVEGELAALGERVVALETHMALEEAARLERMKELVALRDTLQQVQVQLRVREGQLQSLQEELGALKEIDLAPAAPDSSDSRR